MPLFPTTFASPVDVHGPAVHFGDLEAKAAAEDTVTKQAGLRLGQDRPTVRSSTPTRRPYALTVGYGPATNLRRLSGALGSASADQSPQLATSDSSTRSSKKSSHVDRSSATSASTGMSSRPSSYTNSPVEPPAATADQDDDMAGDSKLPVLARKDRHHDRTGGIAKLDVLETTSVPFARASATDVSTSGDQQRVSHNAKTNKPGLVQGLGFELVEGSGIDWTVEPSLADNNKRSTTYTSDLGSGVSSQSASPNTSPAEAEHHDPAVDAIRPTRTRAPRRRQRTHFLAHQVDHHERPYVDTTSASPDLEPEHIVFDTPSTTTRTSARRADRRRPSAPSESASPAFSNAPERRRSTDRTLAALHAQSLHFPPPPHPSHATSSPTRRQSAFSFLPREGPEEKSLKVKLAANGPFPAPPPRSAAKPGGVCRSTPKHKRGASASGLFFRAPPASSSSSSASRSSSNQVFPSSPRVDTNRRHSALEPVVTWDSTDGDELDWLMEASARTVDNHPTRILMDREASARFGGDSDAEDDVAAGSGDDGLDEVFYGSEQPRGGRKARDLQDFTGVQSDPASRMPVTPEAIAALAPVAEGPDKDVALEQWVLDQIASNAVGDNWRRMSAIGEEAEEQDDPAGTAAKPVVVVVSDETGGVSSPASSAGRNIKNLALVPERVEKRSLSPAAPPPPSPGLSVPRTPTMPTSVYAHSNGSSNAALGAPGLSPRSPGHSPSSRPASVSSKSSVRSRLSFSRLNLGSIFGARGATSSDVKHQGISSDSVRHLMASPIDASDERRRTPSGEFDDGGGDDDVVEELDGSVLSPTNNPVTTAQTRAFSSLLTSFAEADQMRLHQIAEDKARARREKLERRRGSLEKADAEDLKQALERRGSAGSAESACAAAAAAAAAALGHVSDDRQEVIA